ncbi:DNA primase [Brevundimonas naejangsanensis]|uniref:DNA primase n=1 Tax=Brevundimonas naejangsanensis TaxID=588932 RepID=A0A494RIP4_9CAUL|nr:DNA primase [Brevundimonas naejangsanensis]AYG96328.1 DNA primase [Brevundimonas naejangsanensis]
MRFDERFIEELKARLRPSDIIGRTVKLKRQGREYVGLSPFSKEKSPSFFVNDDKGFFHDFSSGKHGDVISFLQETERLSFVEAVSRLAAEAGMQLPAEDPQAAEREQKRQGLADWMDLAQKWFAANLRRNVGKAAREYLEKRGLPEDQWERFGLGYAPNDREGLKAALIQRGARPGDLVEAGLLIAPEGGGQPYDRFRDRLMFPILDARGRIVSFGGRAMNPDDRAKYLNGPETSLFHKGATLYGLPEARRILGVEKRGEQGIVVVEGYMDVIACQRAGIAAVAPMGTALTEEQMGLLWRTSAEPTLCFDGDGAGQRAAARTVERALPLLKPERSFQFVTLSGGLDPDDMLREKGAAALREAMQQTVPFSKKLFEKECFDVGALDTPEKEASLLVRLRKAAATIADPDLSKTYKDYLVGAFYQLVRPTEQEKKQAHRVIYRDRKARQAQAIMDVTPEARLAAKSLSQAPKPIMSAVIEGLISYPSIISERAEVLGTQSFGDPDLDRLLGDLVRITYDVSSMSDGLLRSRLRALGHDGILKRVDRTASIAHAPFLETGISLEEAEKSLRRAIDALLQALALNRALTELKRDADFDLVTFGGLKGQRDALERYISSGEIWTDSEMTVH